MANDIVRATRAEFDIAGIPVAGLMMPDGSYRMSDTDIAAAIDEAANSLSHIRRNKTFKALISEGSPLSQKPEKLSVQGNNAKLNCSTIEFAAAYWVLRSKDNNKAFALATALVTESIQRRFDRAFGQHVTEAEYDASLRLRLERLNARRGWTDVVKDRMLELGYYNDSERVREEFRELTVTANLKLFNQPHFQCNRDQMTHEQQLLIGDFERAAERKARQYPNATPYQIVEMALMLF
jgi:hypothetical protein